MRFRLATKLDVFAIMKMVQKSRLRNPSSTMFGHLQELEEALNDPTYLWILCEIDGMASAVMVLKMDEAQGLCKIQHMFVDQELPSRIEILRQLLDYTITYIRGIGTIDVIYTTTLSMPMEQQKVTSQQGFKVLGVFPNALGEDGSKLNGLTAFYFDDVLEHRRDNGFCLHPMIRPFYDLSAKNCGLQNLGDCDQSRLDKQIDQLYQEDPSMVPDLEIIHAENFVRHKFKALKEKRSQLVNFYPFYEPNCLVTDPESNIEVFLRIEKESRFAAIIGEKMSIAINPTQLFIKIQALLRHCDVSYVEIINDAADALGTECILRGGFTPCAYFPAFKKQGEQRHDYVIFGRSFEYLCQPDSQVDEAYFQYFWEYYKVETDRYFPQRPGQGNPIQTEQNDLSQGRSK